MKYFVHIYTSNLWGFATIAFLALYFIFAERAQRTIYGLYLQWEYRDVDPEMCCCGESKMGTGGSSICHYGGCRSAKEYAITSALEKL